MRGSTVAIMATALSAAFVATYLWQRHPTERNVATHQEVALQSPAPTTDTERTIEPVEATRPVAPAPAAPPPQPEERIGFQIVGADAILAANDFNRDGVVTKEEALTAFGSLYEMWDLYDANKDGKVTRGEISEINTRFASAMFHARRVGADAIISLSDQNADGIVTEKEVEQTDKSYWTWGMYDLNKDGMVDRDEIERVLNQFLVENNLSRSPTDEPPRSNDALPTSVKWPPPSTLAFTERADPDPVLSREIEYVIRRSIGTELDQNRYEAQSIECRGQACQILLVDRVPSAGESKPSLVLPILADLKNASIRSPTTGVRPGLPKLKAFGSSRVGEAAGVLAVIEFPEQ